MMIPTISIDGLSGSVVRDGTGITLTQSMLLGMLVGQNKGLELFYVVEQEDPLNDEPAISIGGANGFKEGLVPLLEALGLKVKPQYLAQIFLVVYYQNPLHNLFA